MINIITTSSVIWLISFIIAIIIDLLFKKFLPKKILAVYIKLIDNSYLNIFIALFVIFFLIINILSYFDIMTIQVYNEININIDPNVLHMSGKDDTVTKNTGLIGTINNNTDLDINVAKGANINLNLPNSNITLSIPTNALDEIAAALSYTGGAAAGIKVARMVGGGPATKIGAGLATPPRTGRGAIVQASTSYLAKTISNNSSSSPVPYGGGSNSDKNNFISNSLSESLSNNNHISPDFSQFPLNLIPELEVLSSGILFFIFFLLNIYTVRLIIDVDFSRYLPDNLFGRTLLKIINRYIAIWSKLSNFFLILGWLVLIWCAVLVRLAIYFIANS